MKKWLSLILILSLASTLPACSSIGTQANSTPTENSKTLIGLFSGAIIGGLAGSALSEKGGGRLTAVGLGAVVGGILGGSIGSIMDQKDVIQERKVAAGGNNAVVKNAEAKSNAWQHTTTTAAASLVKPAPTTKPQPQEAQVQSPKKNVTTPSDSIETASARDKSTMAAMNDKIVTLLKKIPSTQWFFDNGNQVG